MGVTYLLLLLYPGLLNGFQCGDHIHRPSPEFRTKRTQRRDVVVHFLKLLEKDPCTHKGSTTQISTTTGEVV